MEANLSKSLLKIVEKENKILLDFRSNGDIFIEGKLVQDKDQFLKAFDIAHFLKTKGLIINKWKN